MAAYDLIAVVGPTAAGKSALGIALAQLVGGEVVNADSMQLYRGMDIGTAKLSPLERAGIPHHLLDLWDLQTAADVATYQRHALGVCDRLRATGCMPVLVGGSGLYVQAVVDRIRFPGTDPTIRARLEAELDAGGPQALHARLAALHPSSAADILPSNGRRLVRALEVVELTGGFQARLPPPAATRVLILGVDRPDLDARVAARVEAMWRAGLVEEVRELAARGLREGRTASRALGYAQVLAWFDGAVPSEGEAKDRVVSATRRFVRRQRSWFRRDPRVRWLSAEQAADPAGVLAAGSVGI